MSAVLFHGTSKKLSLLRPHFPKSTRAGTKRTAIYATDSRDIALGMALTSQPHSTSFADLKKNPFRVHFVWNSPRMKFVYLYHLPKKFFEKIRKHEYASFVSVKPTKVEKIPVEQLGHLWKRVPREELEKFLKTRK